MVIKDPVYGYVEIDKDIKFIIDTPSFQRLRDIVQTNYFPLFPTSIHNRFAHSLGVYYLGKKAIKSLCENFQKRFGDEVLTKAELDEIKRFFLLACLLHDIGHSPFSHTGEDFYYDEKSSESAQSNPKLIDNLKTYLNDEEFNKDITVQIFCSPKPHEYMSAYLGVKEFLDEESSTMKSFFVRCIIGLQYYNCKDIKLQFMNACIELLNSTTIDVDKLDYLIRDSYMTGYDSVNIDYKRLLKGISLNELSSDQECNLVKKQKKDGTQTTYRHIFVAFKRAAISVLENVILANDLERKWLQSHPIVLYGSFLLQVIIKKLNSNIEKINIGANCVKPYLFSYDSLTAKGTAFGDKFSIKFLSDSDILYLAKNMYYDNWSKEYFDRNLWRHPLWKSEAEYNILFKRAGNIDILLDTFKDIEKDLLEGRYNQNSINGDLLKAYENELNAGHNSSVTKSKSAPKSIDAVMSKLQRKVTLLRCLNEYCALINIDLDFVVKTTNQFTSGMIKADFKNIQIQFDDLEKSESLFEVLPLLNSTPKDDTFFYLYHIDAGKKIKAQDICSKLASVIFQ